MPEPYWAVAKVQGQREAFAAGHLEARGFEIFLPKIETKRAILPLLPSYLFVRIVDRWRAIETTFGVLALIRFGEEPARCPDREVDALKARANEKGIITLPPAPTKRLIKPGARVRVVSGPFQGLNGIFQGQSTRDRVLVLMSVLNATRPVKISAASIAPMH